MTHLQVLAAVLENTQDGENEIEGESQGESPGNRRLKESKVVRMKLPAQVGGFIICRINSNCNKYLQPMFVVLSS